MCYALLYEMCVPWLICLYGVFCGSCMYVSDCMSVCMCSMYHVLAHWCACRYLSKNCSAVIQVEVARPVCLECYQDCKELGRITLREGGNTIAAGLVTKVIPPPHI